MQTALSSTSSMASTSAGNPPTNPATTPSAQNNNSNDNDNKVLVDKEEWRMLRQKNNDYKNQVHLLEYKLLQAKNLLLEEKLERATEKEGAEKKSIQEGQQTGSSAVCVCSSEAVRNEILEQLKAENEQSLQQLRQQVELQQKEEMEYFIRDLHAHYEQALKNNVEIIREENASFLEKNIPIPTTPSSSSSAPPAKRARQQDGPEEGEFYLCQNAAEVEAHAQKLKEITTTLGQLATKETFQQLKVQVDELQNSLNAKTAKLDADSKYVLKKLKSSQQDFDELIKRNAQLEQRKAHREQPAVEAFCRNAVEVEAHSKKLEEITKSLEKLATNEKFEQLKLQQDEHRNFVYHKIAKVDLQQKSSQTDFENALRRQLDELRADVQLEQQQIAQQLSELKKVAAAQVGSEEEIDRQNETLLLLQSHQKKLEQMNTAVERMITGEELKELKRECFERLATKAEFFQLRKENLGKMAIKYAMENFAEKETVEKLYDLLCQQNLACDKLAERFDVGMKFAHQELTEGLEREKMRARSSLEQKVEELKDWVVLDGRLENVMLIRMVGNHLINVHTPKINDQPKGVTRAQRPFQISAAADVADRRLFYFEVCVHNRQTNEMFIGLSEPGFYESMKFAVTNEGHCLVSGEEVKRTHQGGFSTGDFIGCGLLILGQAGTYLFFTRNGRIWNTPITLSYAELLGKDLYPTVTAWESSTMVAPNFGEDIPGAPFLFDDANSLQTIDIYEQT